VRRASSSAMDLGSVIVDCGYKHYNRVSGKEISEC
jgi:hypothetical protein